MQIKGYDNAGIPRVYGHGSTKFIAVNECIKAAQDYLLQRKDIPYINILREPGYTIKVMI